MKKNNEDGAIFYAPDSFDRSVLTYCTSNPIISNTAIGKSDTSDGYVYAMNSISDLATKSIGINGSVDIVKDNLSELKDRVAALEAAMAAAAVTMQQKAPVPMRPWRYDRRDYKTLQ